MKKRWLCAALFALLGGCASVPGDTAQAVPNATAAQTRTMVDGRIEVYAQGSGPLVVMLPSRGRGAEDFFELAPYFVKAGYRVVMPQPRGIGKTTGAMKDITLHDLANDTAAVIRSEGGKPALVVGHAFGNWVARMTGVDHPELVRGVVIVAAAAKKYPAGLSEHVDRSAELSLPDAERLKSIQYAFFAPGHDAKVWLHGWYPEVSESQRMAGKATKQSEWWSGGAKPLLDLQAENDLFKPVETRGEIRDEFGERVTVKVIPNAGHALVPEQPAAVAEAIISWDRGLK
ncbi:alpha/beta fold hydrolase [Massilia horti]|uniref:Alpha/beta hydrolase n=1 Tax=Massilia horti TaxID=2562153 RepID=A0A4Y9T977_9BURK|nr:alpha/beta hydrolase [Massilia horti]TFW35645.1 alpha/beta hydrolase [Massilia horti]